MPWGKKDSEEKVHPAEMCDGQERPYRKNLRGYPKAGVPHLFFFFLFFTVPCVVSARVFTLAHCDSLCHLSVSLPKIDVFLNTDYLIIISCILVLGNREVSKSFFEE